MLPAGRWLARRAGSFRAGAQNADVIEADLAPRQPEGPLRAVLANCCTRRLADVTPAASVSRPGRIVGLSVTMLSTSVSTSPHSYALLVTAGLEDVAAASIAELLPGLTIRVQLC